MSDQVNWVELADRASVDPLELKRRLDLVGVCEELGILLEEGADGKWSGLCPFHDDHRESFDVYETDDGFQRCGCWSCDFGTSNDVYDLLQTLRGCSFGQALTEAQSLAGVVRAHERSVAVSAPVDLSSLVDTAHARALANQDMVKALLSERSIAVNAEWVVREFDLGVTPDEAGVVIPHRGPDGTVVAAKTRRPDRTEERPWTPIAVSGSKLNQMYGAWRDQGRPRVAIVEGESDTWTLAWLLRNENFEVFGLPSGAAAKPRREWLDQLADRDVTLMFDADDAGRVAARNWTAGLAVCRIAQLREGTDVTSELPERVVAALNGAQPYGMAPSPGLVEAPYGGHLVRAGDENQTMVSDFIPTLSETVELPGGGQVFRLRMPRGELVDLPSSVFTTDRAMRSWANKHGYTWQGITKDVQELHRMLGIDGVFKPRVLGTHTAGWADGAFVLPEPHGVLGSKAWTYVPPETVRNLDELISLQPGPWDPQIPATLTAMHQPDVITPIVGWVAASMLRPYLTAFPILAVVGIAGAGKSTLVREVLGTFGLHIGLTLTSTTPMSVTGFASVSNALPVWFDEYRAGARADARFTFEQVLRDAWESQSSYKGGFGDQKQEVHALAASSPIVVTGEDAFSETSHLERMVLINLPSTGRSPAALSTLYGIERAGFGRVYVEWLLESLTNGTLTAPPKINNRPEHARAVAAWGYGVFSDFAREVCGAELVPYDGSRVAASHDTATALPSYVELIRTCESRIRSGTYIAWRDTEDGTMCLRIHDAVQVARDLGIKLPGGARALRNEIEDKYPTADGHSDTLGAYLKIWDFA